MRFDSVKELKGEVFRRLTGIQRNTFEAMAAVLSDAKCKQKAAGGKPNTLSVENQLLMMLEYWREYRTYFHIGQAYGISESAAYRNIKWCENTLAKSKSFRLPDRKAVAASDRAFDVDLDGVPGEWSIAPGSDATRANVNALRAPLCSAKSGSTHHD